MHMCEIVMWVTDHFPIGFKTYAMSGNSILVLLICQEPINEFRCPRSEPTTIILLKGHSIKLLSTYISILID